MSAASAAGLPVARLPRPGGWTLPLSLRLTAAMVVLIAATLLLTTGLNYVKFRRTLEGLADSRFSFVLDELGGAIESGIALGVPLNALENVQYLLDQQQRRDPAILSIDVADAHGHLLHSSLDGRAGQTLPLEWDLQAAQAESHATLRAMRSGVVTLGQPLRNAFNETLGVVVLRYATARYEATEQAVLHRLLVQAGAMALLFSLLALLGFRLLLRGFRGSVQRMSASLQAVLRGMPLVPYHPANGIERQFAGLLLLLQGRQAAAPPAGEAPESAVYGRAVMYRMFGLTALVLVLPLGLMGLSATRAFEAALVPEMHQKAAALAQAVVADLDHALRLGIPLDRLVGVQPYLQDQLPLVPEALYVAVERAPGELLYAAGRSTAKLVRGGRIADTAAVSDLAVGFGAGAGQVHVGLSRAMLDAQLRDIAADVVVLSAAGLLMTFEILLLVVACGVSHPLALLGRLIGDVARGDLAVRVAGGSRSDMARLLRLIDLGLERLRGAAALPAAQVRDMHAANPVFIRTPLFLFCFAEEFVRSFFPLYAQGLAANVPWLSAELLTGLPITLFMLVVAVCTPVAAVYSDRIGRRPTFLLGALVSTAGLLLSAGAAGYWDMLLYRAISGIGYAAVFIACQGYLMDNSSAKDRAQAVAVYVGAIAAADLCSPPIGGILADQFGFRLSFVAAACFAFAALLLAWRLVRDNPAARVHRPPLRLGDIARLGRNWRLKGLILCASMPAKLLLTGFLFYLVPLHLVAIGQTPYTVGRVMMVYALGSLLISPLVARLVDRWRLDQSAVLGGSALAAASLALVWADAGLWHVVAAVAGFGAGQAICITTQAALVTRYAADKVERMGTTTVVSVFRLCERLGAALGPLLAGTLLARCGAQTAMALLGLGGLALLAGFALALLAGRRPGALP